MKSVIFPLISGSFKSPLTGWREQKDDGKVNECGRAGMKIAEITQSLGNEGGGVASSVLDMVRETRQRGLDVHLFSSASDSAQALTAEFGENAHLNEFYGPISIAYQPALKRALAALDPDLVHLHGLWGYPSYLLAQRASHKAKIISPHGMLDSWARNNAKWKKDIASALFEKRNIETATCIRALCEAEKVSIRENFPNVPVAVIPNGVRMPAENIRPETVGWRHRIPSDGKVMLFLGRIHKKKGLALLIAALDILVRKNAMEKWHLVIAGWDDGGECAALQETLAGSGLSERVHFVGPQFGEDRDLSYRAADLFVLPSYSEGLPMAILEAWSYGVPVVMTAACNIPEGFSRGAAIEIDTDVESLELRLGDVFQMDAAALSEIGQKGRSLVEERFSWASVSQDMAQLYAWAANPETQHPHFVEMGAER